MIDNYLMLLFALLSVVTIIFIIWLSRNLLDVCYERDEWRERAVDTNAALQEMEQLKYYEDTIARHRDDGLRPYRALTQINWDKTMKESHSTRNPNQGE
mgnify:FL=1